jgi:hypothetical protein
MHEHLKKIPVIFLASILSALTMTAFAAHSGGGHAGGGHLGGAHGGGGGGFGLGLGLFTGALIGSELAAPYYPYYYPYPGGVVQSTPYTYETQPINQAAPNPTSSTPGVWYYCVSSKTYYPYVSSCSESWKIIPATPPQP